mmetsp:Transcript_68830/g.165220  ORF Transcript_68830/g.165220 Transcript_68830/m.165220 type:complete len:227 (+) Transcript_68830:299-979(+)
MSAVLQVEQCKAGFVRVESLVGEKEAANDPDWLQGIAPLASDAVPGYLKAFGFHAVSAMAWSSDEAHGAGVHLQLRVLGHDEVLDHTWYVLDCTLTNTESTDEHETQVLQWKVARRLGQLRDHFHDPIKGLLPGTSSAEQKSYNELFGDARFARKGGIPGTTQRLDAWCQALSSHVSAQRVPPSAAALTLRFLEAPYAECPSVKAMRAAAPAARSLSRAHPDDCDN